MVWGNFSTEFLSLHPKRLRTNRHLSGVSAPQTQSSMVSLLDLGIEFGDQCSQWHHGDLNLFIQITNWNLIGLLTGGLKHGSFLSLFCMLSLRLLQTICSHQSMLFNGSQPRNGSTDVMNEAEDSDAEGYLGWFSQLDCYPLVFGGTTAKKGTAKKTKQKSSPHWGKKFIWTPAMHQQNINPNHLESNIAAYVLPKVLPFRWQKNPRCSDERTQRSSPGWLKGSKRMGRSLKEHLFSSHFHSTFPDQEPQPVPVESITIRQWKAPWLCCFYKIL